MLDDVIKRRNDVKLVAFGTEKSSYFVLFEDGGFAWNELPRKLVKILEKCRRSELPPLDFVSLGPRGQYFVRYANGNWHAGGCSKAEDRVLDEVQGSVREVTFGYPGIIVRYNPSSEQRKPTFKDESIASLP